MVTPKHHPVNHQTQLKQKLTDAMQRTKRAPLRQNAGSERMEELDLAYDTVAAAVLALPTGAGP